jgi:hypothetical protein
VDFIYNSGFVYPNPSPKNQPSRQINQRFAFFGESDTVKKAAATVLFFDNMNGFLIFVAC